MPRKSHDFWKTSRFSKKPTIFLHAQKLIVVQGSSHSLKQIQPKRTSKSRSARGLRPKNPYLENRCQIRLSLAISLTPTWHFGANQNGGFRTKWNSLVFLSCSTQKKGHLFCVAPQNIDNSQSPDFLASNSRFSVLQGWEVCSCSSKVFILSGIGMTWN